MGRMTPAEQAAWKKRQMRRTKEMLIQMLIDQMNVISAFRERAEKVEKELANLHLQFAQLRRDYQGRAAALDRKDQALRDLRGLRTRDISAAQNQHDELEDKLKTSKEAVQILSDRLTNVTARRDVLEAENTKQEREIQVLRSLFLELYRQGWTQ